MFLGGEGTLQCWFGDIAYAMSWRVTSGSRVARALERSRGVSGTLGWSEGVRREGGSNSVVESQPSKLLVAGSIPVSRSILRPAAPRGIES